MLAFVVVAGAAALALLVGSPWKDSPGFLERAQAALTPPSGTILHYRYEETQSAGALGCTVTTGPREVWIDRHRRTGIALCCPTSASRKREMSTSVRVSAATIRCPGSAVR